jgi:hypothetical protein
LECLSQRCEYLENETIKLKDHDIKSRIQIKELENKILSLEEAIKGLTAPKKQQATPFNFSSGQKVRNPFKKAQSVDVVAAHDPEINYDNIKVIYQIENNISSKIQTDLLNKAESESFNSNDLKNGLWSNLNRNHYQIFIEVNNLNLLLIHRIAIHYFHQDNNNQMCKFLDENSM